MYQTFYQNQNFMKNKNTWGMNNLGKPHVKILGVQLEFCRKGWWVETPCQMGCGNSSLNMTITEAFDLHHISPLYTMISIRIPSKNHVIVSISIPNVKNAVLKNLLIFGQKSLPQSVRLLEPQVEGRGVEMLFGKMPFEHAVSLRGASLTLWAPQ